MKASIIANIIIIIILADVVARDNAIFINGVQKVDIRMD